MLDINHLKKILQEFSDVRDWNQFHNPKNLAMALAGESGELLEIFQWMSDKDSNNAFKDADIKEKTSHEIADILLYLIRLADLMNINLSEALTQKILINNQRYPAHLVKGNAKKYTEY